MKTGLAKLGHRYGPPLAFAAATAAPRLAMAQLTGGAGMNPQSFVQNIINFLSGPFGQSVFVLAIIACGFIGWWAFHRIMGILAGIVVGAILVFGGAYLGGMVNGAGGGAVGG
jgi:type IV secretion system protein VirB2